MRYTTAEKLEIIRLVDGSELGINRTLKELGIHKNKFYNWYNKSQRSGPEGFHSKGKTVQQVWNKILVERERMVETTLEKSPYSARELAQHITDILGYYISESSIYRILRQYGLVLAPGHIVYLFPIRSRTKPLDLTRSGRQLHILQGYWLGLVLLIHCAGRLQLLHCCLGAVQGNEVKGCTEHHHKGPGTHQAGKEGPSFSVVRIATTTPLSLMTSSKLSRWTSFMAGRCTADPGKERALQPQYKNVVNLENYYSPEELEQAMVHFVDNYNHHRYHKSIQNLTLVQV